MAFSDRSRGRMEGLDPRLIEILTAARESSGVPFEISEGLRDVERQKKMVEQGKSQTMNSKHLTGNAMDIHIMNPDGTVNWDFEAYRPIADAAKLAAADLGYDDFVWGGDWETLKDGVHFQIGGNHTGHDHAAHGHEPSSAHLSGSNGVGNNARKNSPGAKADLGYHELPDWAGGKLQAGLAEKIGGERMAGLGSGLLGISQMLMDDDNAGMF